MLQHPSIPDDANLPRHEFTCEWCGYQSPSPTCPECGKFTDANRFQRRAMWKRRLRNCSLLLAMFVLVTLVIAILPAATRSAKPVSTSANVEAWIWLVTFVLAQLAVAATLFETVRAAVVVTRHDYVMGAETRQLVSRWWFATFALIMMLLWGLAFVSSW